MPTTTFHSTRIRIRIHFLPKLRFKSAIKRSAKKLQYMDQNEIPPENLRFSGFLWREGGHWNYEYSTSTRLQISQSLFQAQLPILREEMGRSGIKIEILPSLWEARKFGVILGLREGFEYSSPTHTIEELLHALGTLPINFMPGQILSVSLSRSYSEPAIALRFDDSGFIPYIIKFARHIRQEFVPIIDRDQNITYTIKTLDT